MLLKLTVSTREIIVIANVAFNRGSSQQGNARRAAVGCFVGHHKHRCDDLRWTNLKLRKCVVLRLSLVFPGRFIVPRHVACKLPTEANVQLCLGTSGERSRQLVCDTLLDRVKRLTDGSLRRLESIGINRSSSRSQTMPIA